MKIRLSYVTNSSSSSYICEITGRQESGWDMNLSDANMVECENGHVFDSNYILKSVDELTKEEVIRYFKESIESDTSEYWKERYLDCLKRLENNISTLEEICEEMEWNSGYEIPDIMCPICMFKILSMSEMISYLEKETNIKKSEVFESIKKENKRRRKLYDYEYVDYCLKSLGKTKEEVQNEVFDKYGNAENFYKFIES